ncbi:MAG: hypothetical protein ACE14M_04785 [Terriglobales bacterium]
MADALQRLKILLNSSTPIVVMETVEELRAVNLVRSACAELNLPTFEWSIANGLVRSGSNANLAVPGMPAPITYPTPGDPDSQRLAAAVFPPRRQDAENAATAIYNTCDPVQALANMQSISFDAVFILKDFHRHMDNAVIVRRLRDVGQKFSAHRRTVVITAPAITIPPELASLVEYLDIPLPDTAGLRQIIDETFERMSKTYSLMCPKPWPASAGWKT